MKARLAAIARKFRWYVRQISGDAAYDNYLRHVREAKCRHHEAAPLSREQFYLDSLRRRYSGVSRCC